MTTHHIKPKFLKLLLLLLCCTACQQHFITDPAERALVEQDFNTRKQAFAYRLESLESEEASPQLEALQFLYAYMPIGDITDYSVDYYKQHIDWAFRAKETMPWGKDIPEREFRHFVLPVRVNNEALDKSREEFYHALKERVKGLSLYEAVLEVNHWCHEKVSYAPSDARTSAPGATVAAATGRCGEESTLLVAALRAVCIPARQVYTPRWAHTDDNHAWVEAWVDGKWHFLGACEPEPVLNLGWFNAPASRGMLMHTKAFGRYNGPEEVMSRTANYTEINVIDHYAPTASATVNVTDENGTAIEGALVEFKLYNYAEFHTVASKTTDSKGKASLTAGRGDMLVWASHNGKFGFKPCSFGKDTVLTIPVSANGELSKSNNATAGKQGSTAVQGNAATGKASTSLSVPGNKAFCSLTLDITPPAEQVVMPEVTPAQREANNRRLAREDSLRNAYISTFITENEANRIAALLHMDTAIVSPLLQASRNNYNRINHTLALCQLRLCQQRAQQLLTVLTAKDLRDITPNVMYDHAIHTLADKDSLSALYVTDSLLSLTKFVHEFYVKYVLNPRVANETLTPYKGFFQKKLSATEQETYRKQPEALVAWCRKELTLKDEWNPQNIPVSPKGVWESRITDRHSRSIFFVSVLRSLGIPARIDEVTGHTQYAQHGNWQDVTFEAETPTVPQTVHTLKASYTPIQSLPDPKYYTHFTLSKLNGGVAQLLNYNEAVAGIEDGTTWSNLLKNGTKIDAGDYLMVTGTRLANGGVLACLNFFTVDEQQPVTTTRLIMRESQDEVQVIGTFNSESAYLTPEGEQKSLLQTCGRGYYIIGILGVGQEPTNHALRDIAQKATELEACGRKMVLLFPDKQQLAKFRPEEFPGLPANIIYGIDEGGRIEKQIATEMKLPRHCTLPVFLIGDTFNRAVFFSQGYTIGLGEQLNKVMHQVVNP